MVRLTKWHNGAESREMVRAEGWVMVRRKGAAPYLVRAKEWDDLPPGDIGSERAREYRQALEAHHDQ